MHMHTQTRVCSYYTKTTENKQKKEIIKGSFRKETPSVGNKVKNWNKVKTNSGFIRNKASEKAIE